MELLVSQTHDPYVNLACERALMERGETAVFLWVNRPCVVIGRNQNPYRETDPTYLQSEDIALARRCTGGGAVYHDLQNLNYSYVAGTPDAGEFQRMALAVLEHLGIDAVWSGRNDLMVSGKKAGGFAELFDSSYLCHGTLMVDVDLRRMEGALRPSSLKLKSHGIESVRARVANLREADPHITIERIMTAFEDTLQLRAKPATTTDAIMREAERLASPAWLFDESPSYDVSLERRLPDGNYRFEICVKRGMIADVAVYADSLDVTRPQNLRTALIGVRMLPETIAAALEAAYGDENSRP